MICPDCRESPTQLCAYHHVSADNLNDESDRTMDELVNENRKLKAENEQLRADLSAILDHVRSMGCPPATDEACPMCVLERLVRAALAAKTTKDRCEPTIDRPPLAPEIVAALGEEIYHRATCAYCAWVGPDRPLREPMDQDERDHLATCEKNPARTVEAELADAREGLGRWKSRADQLTLDLQEARATALRVAPTVFR